MFLSLLIIKLINIIIISGFLRLESIYNHMIFDSFRIYDNQFNPDSDSVFNIKNIEDMDILNTVIENIPLSCILF